MKSVWDTIVTEYQEIEDAGLGISISKSLLPKAEDQVLDAGCGIGTQMKGFIECADFVVGVDGSWGMLERAVNVGDVLYADICRLPLADASFSYVWSRVVLSYVENWERGLAELLRVCKPGGRLIIHVARRRSFAFPFRSALCLFGKYSEGKIRHLELDDFHRQSILGYRVASCCSVQKNARSQNAFFRFASWILYGLDGIFSFLIPNWGGDLCVELIKE